jgi:hypothetical protein
MTASETEAIRHRVIYNVATKDEVIAVCDALDAERAAHADTTAQFEEYHTLATQLFGDLVAEREKVRVLQTYLWRIRDAVMHEGGWCYDYRTEEGARIAEAVHTIWREARDAGHEPFARAALAEEGGTS